MKKQQGIYFFQINVNQFFPAQNIIQKIDKNSYLKVILIRQSTQTMFVSQKQTISQFKNYIKPFLYKEKISLNQQFLKFSIKINDIVQNQFFLKIMILKSQSITSQLTYYKINIHKYIQMSKLEAKKYFQQTLSSKCGSKANIQVYMEKNRAALESLISSVNSQKRRKRSLSVKKSRSPVASNLTIQQLYTESQNKKNIRKSNQKLDATKNPKKQKNKLIQNQKTQKLNQTVSHAKNYGQNQQSIQRKNLQFSKITEVYNSQLYSQVQKTNILDSRLNDNTISQINNNSRSRKSQSNRNLNGSIHDKLQMTEPLRKVDQITQQIEEDSKGVKKNRILEEVIVKSSEISSISSLSSYSSRSFVQAIDLDSQHSSLAHSSEVSATSELHRFHQKKNNIVKILLILLSLIAVIYLLFPKDRIQQSQKIPHHKKHHKNSKR